MTHYFSAANDPNVLKELRDAIYRGKCILLVGSGLSVQAQTEDGEHPPDWKGLLERMILWCSERGLVDQETAEGIHILIDEGFLIEAGQEIEEHLLKNQQQHQCLREALLCDQAKVSEIHRLVAEIPFRAYLTTNYDTFIEAAYSMVKGKFLARFYETSIQNAITEYREREDRPFILKLHGDIDNPDSIILGDRGFERLLHSASNYWRDLEKLLALSSILFIGFGKSDHDLEGFLNKIDVFNKSNRHWMVVPESHLPVLKAKRLREEKGIRIIQYKDDETHSELVKFLKELSAPLSPIRLTSEEGIRINRLEVISEFEAGGSLQVDSKTALPQKSSGPLSLVLEPTRTIKIFYSYAPEDEKLRQQLEKQLRILRYNGLITEWYNREISAGEDKESEITEQLNSADIILLLVSTDFIASDYCYGFEVKRAMERHNLGDARVIPVILRPVFDWKNTPFGKLQVLPKNENPVVKWSNQDAAFANVAEGIKNVVEEMNAAGEDRSSVKVRRQKE
jgi:hypothetical protein